MKFLYFISLIIFILLVVACTDSPSKTTFDEIETEEIEVQFPLQLPASLGLYPATSQENFVKSIYILAFRVENTGIGTKEYFDYMAPATSLVDVGSDSRYKQFTVTLFKKNYQQRFVVIANADTEVLAQNVSAEDNVEKEGLLRMLDFSNSDAWYAMADNDNFVALPMWGETEQIYINDFNNQIGIVKLLRMVARIDVELKTQEAQEIFELNSLYVYNYYDKGRICPDQEVWNESEYKVSGVSLPVSGASKIRGPLAVDGDKGNIPTTYVFESTGTSLDDSSNATCIVVGGYFNSSDKETYYRIDFFDKDENGTIQAFRDLLRNHVYFIQIMSVSGEGYNSPDEAFNSTSVNMTVNIKEWDEGEITEVVFDSQYMLGVSQTKFEIPLNANTYKLLVTTDVPAGWNAVITGGDDWITGLEGAFTGTDRKEELSFTVLKNETGESRTGYITITAGRLSLVITIEQGISENLTLRITDTGDTEISDLIFCSYDTDVDPKMQEYNVIWTPSSKDCLITAMTIGTYPFEAEPGNNPIGDNLITGGLWQYSVIPVAYNGTEIETDPFKEKTTRLMYVVEEGDNMVTKSLTLHHIFYNLQATAKDSYMMDGSEYSFLMSTNAVTWSAEVTGGNKELITLHQTSGTKNIHGINFGFTIIDEDTAGTLSGNSAIITFTYYGLDGAYGTKEVIINGTPSNSVKVDGSNSYILLTGGKGVKFPVAWANKAVQRINPDDDVRLKIVWLDADTGVGNTNSIISDYYISGTGSGAQITVIPGNQPGNALIAAVVDNTIKWSWHIWVLEHDPTLETVSYNGHTWMMINLGAINNTPGESNSIGLLYQWGRKDPFPGMTYSSMTEAKTVYDENGTPVELQRVEVTGNNLENSIQSPVTIYYKGANNSWYAPDTFDQTLWGAVKTQYDPCPYGWKVPHQLNNSVWGSDNGTWSENGFTYSPNSNLGYWPATGRINSSTGNHEANANRNEFLGFYWSGLSNNEFSQYMKILSNSTSPNRSNSASAAGMAMRCVKE